MPTNKTDMVPVSVVNMFIQPIKEHITSTTQSIEKLVDSVDDMSKAITEEIVDHNKECMERNLYIQKCYRDSNEKTSEGQKAVIKEIDNKILSIDSKINILDERLLDIEKNVNNIKESIITMKDSLRNVIIVIVVGFTLFTAVYTIANFVVRSQFSHVTTVERGITTVR